MLISVKENVFKKEVEIKFNNITEGFNRYKNKTISAINEENFERGMICFLQEAVKLNGIENSYVDFYYNNLEEDEKRRLKQFINSEDKEFIRKFENENGMSGVYFNLTLESIPFITRITSKEVLFSTIYFVKKPFTIWGNYNKKFPVFYREKGICDEYSKLAEKFNLKII